MTNKNINYTAVKFIGTQSKGVRHAKMLEAVAHYKEEKISNNRKVLLNLKSNYLIYYMQAKL